MPVAAQVKQTPDFQYDAGVIHGNIRDDIRRCDHPLTLRAESIITALPVISAAVPAVVLIATSGNAGVFHLPTPE